MTLMQNYILSICLMKNIAVKYMALANPTEDNTNFYQLAIKTQIEQLSEVEAIMILKKQEAMGPHFSGKLPKQEKSRVVPVEQGMIPIAEEISISYLII